MYLVNFIDKKDEARGGASSRNGRSWRRPRHRPRLRSRRCGGWSVAPGATAAVALLEADELQPAMEPWLRGMTAAGIHFVAKGVGKAVMETMGKEEEDN